MEYGVYSIGAKPIYLDFSRHACGDNAFLRVAFEQPFLRGVILTPKWTD
jgi:hypothetical protein